MKIQFVLKAFITLSILSCLTSCKEVQKKESLTESKSVRFFVGTYTDGESEGIYQYTISEDGKLTKMGLMAVSENPSFLAYDKNRQFLLAVNEVSNEEGVGFVSSYKIDADSLIFINQQSSGGAHPCHIAIDEEGQIVVANYSGGNMGLLKLKDEGSLSELLDVQQHEGSGIHERQEGPHAHSGWFTKDGSIVSVDLGTNQLWFSQIDRDSLKFVAQEPGTFDLEEGAGPRHLVFHPDKNIMYVVNELTSSVSLVKKDPVSGSYSIEQTISTLPKDFNEPNTCADIHISSDGKYVYASNRGHNSIAIFSVDDSGQLSSIGHQSTQGETPRNVTLSPDEKYVLIANQTSNNIVSFARDGESGLLSFIDEIEAPSPVCLLF